jgi:hypothetical protein
VKRGRRSTSADDPAPTITRRQDDIGFREAFEEAIVDHGLGVLRDLFGGLKEPSSPSTATNRGIARAA